MKGCWLLALWLGTVTAVWAQKKPLGKAQLLQRLRTTTEDTTRLNTLIALADNYTDQNLDSSLYFGTQALAAAKQYGKPNQLSQSYYVLGWTYRNRGDLKAALAYLNRALQVAEANHLGEDAMKAQASIGGVYADRGLYPMALKYYLQALRYCEQHPKRADYYAGTLQSVGNCYFGKGDYATAVKYYRRSEAAVATAQDKSGLAYTYLGMGAAYVELQQLTQAEKITEKARQLFVQERNQIQTASAVLNLAEIYFRQNRLEDARRAYEQALKLAQETNDETTVMDVNIGLTRVGIRQGAFGNAEKILAEQLVKSRRYDNLPVVQEVYKVMGELAEAQGDYRRALQVQRQETRLRDSLVGAESQEKMALLQNEYENYQREQQVVRQGLTIRQLEQQRKIGWLWAGLAGALALGGAVAGTLWARQQRLGRQRDQAQAEAQAAAAAAEQLAAQARLQQVQHQLDLKNQELTNLALSLTQKGEFLEGVRGQIDSIARTTDTEARRQLQRLRLSIDHNARTEQDWAQFNQAFEQIHRGFFTALQQRCPELTPYELKLAGLLKLNLTSKDMAALLGISEDSVKKARYRIRRKLQLEGSDNLVEFMMRLDGHQTVGQLANRAAMDA